jgi:hypothetical protein
MITLSTRSGILGQIIKCEISSLLVILVHSIRDHSPCQILNRIHTRTRTLSRRSRRVLHFSICLDHQITSIRDLSSLTEAHSMSSISMLRMMTSWSSWKMGRRSNKQEQGMRMIRNRSMSMRSSITGLSRGEQRERDWRSSTG